MVKEKRVAVIECLESIPCNPCGFICPVDAIRKDSLVAPPVMDWEKCVGCTKCVPICPGLAIFLVNMSLDGGAATVSLPYEYLPLPSVGDTVVTLSREGEVLGEGTVERVLSAKALDRTPIITLSVPADHAMDVRHFLAKDATA